MDEVSGSSKNRLNAVILSQGRHRKWVAQQLGISRMTLHRWCHEGTPVPDPQQDALSELLGVPRDHLFPEEEILDAAA